MFRGFQNSLIDQSRNVGLDYLRGIAVLLVLLYHFNGFFDYGYLGVDIFFAISGYLVGGSLIRRVLEDKKINFKNFFLKRGFKIWPSYYFFFVVALILTAFLPFVFGPENKLGLAELPRYLFWYRNFRGEPFHFSFDHVWSLCVEEHFYVLLPACLMLLGVFIKKKVNIVALTFLFGVFGALLFKFLVFYFTKSKVTYLMTFSHLDGFSWGILVAYLDAKKYQLKRAYWNLILVIIGFAGIALTVYLEGVYKESGFKQLYSHSFIALFSGLILFGFSRFKAIAYLKPLQFAGYYSYNIYLWNPLVSLFLVRSFGYNSYTFVAYMVISVFVAVIATVLIEERFIRIRDRVLN